MQGIHIRFCPKAKRVCGTCQTNKGNERELQDKNSGRLSLCFFSTLLASQRTDKDSSLRRLQKEVKNINKEVEVYQ